MMGCYRSFSTIPYVSNVSHNNPILAVGISKSILILFCCGTVFLRTFLFIINLPILPLAVCYYKVHTISFKFLFPRISPLRERRLSASSFFYTTLHCVPPFLGCFSTRSRLFLTPLLTSWYMEYRLPPLRNFITSTRQKKKLLRRYYQNSNFTNHLMLSTFGGIEVSVYVAHFFGQITTS